MEPLRTFIRGYCMEASYMAHENTIFVMQLGIIKKRSTRTFSWKLLII